MTPLLLAVLLADPPPPPTLPAPGATPSVNKQPVVVGWPADTMPTAPAGFKVTKFAAEGLQNPRWLYPLPGGDLLLIESKTTVVKAVEKPDPMKKPTGPPPSGRIMRLKDTNGDGIADVTETFADGLNRPTGVAVVGDTFYVANTDALMAYPYKAGDAKLDTTKGRKVIDLQVGGYNNHWTRNVAANKDGSKLYITVGSASNVGENGTAAEMLRCCILEVNLDGTGLKLFAEGIRNPVGLAWEPVTGKLWTAVNERDGLGDDLVPDYLTSVTPGGFYGFPYAYFGPNEDPRRKGERPDLVAKTLVPDVSMGSHTASLGLAFGPDSLPAKYRGGAFVGQRGSWNRSAFSGYRVAFVPFKNGKPDGPPEDFLAGFIKNDKEVYGRPVGVAFDTAGAMYVADEMGKIVWRVAAEAAK